MKPKIIGVNVRWYPKQGIGETDDDTRSPIKVVLVAGQIGDYAAYAGAGEDEWVARFGDKICFEEALVHFPYGLEREKYRE